MRELICLYVKCSIFLHGLLFSCGEYFSSSSHLSGLLHFEIKLADELKGLVQHEEERLSRIKEFLNRTDHAHNNPAVNSYIENPIYSYLTIKRLQDDWPELRKQIYSVYLTRLARNKEQLPSEDDLYGARLAFLRLQTVFVLPAKDIVEGIAQDTAGIKLGAEDAYEIGKIAYDREEYKLAASWMNEALRLTDEGRYSGDALNRSLLLHYVAWSEYRNNDMQAAFQHSYERYRLNPRSDTKRFMEFMNTTRKDVEILITSSTKIHPKKQKVLYCTNYVESVLEIEEAREQALCRGETDPMPEEYKRMLKCWYKSDHPLLILKPVRIEMLYPKPRILLFRNILSDTEINAVKNIAIPQLFRATVNNPNTGKPEHLESRVSKSAWLRGDDFKLIDKINKRTEAFTGLDESSAEPLQIANYGMGGHYERHFDFSRNVPLRPPPWKNRTDTYLRIDPKEREIAEEGERIATLLYYMSDVSHGGATVFLNIGQAVKPSKGDGVFWYNLNHDGSGDYDTCHAACPVLLGEKWISNRWFRERGQEFRRRCNLRPEDD